MRPYACFGPVVCCVLTSLLTLAACHKTKTVADDVSIRATLVATPTTLPTDGVSTSRIDAVLTHASGAPRQGLSLHLVREDTGLRIVDDMAETDASGTATGTVRCLTPGHHEVGITTQYNDEGVLFVAYATLLCLPATGAGVPDADTSIFMASPKQIAVDDPNGIVVTVTVRDSSGAPVAPQTPIFLTASEASTTCNPNVLATDPNGEATSRIRSTRATAQVVTASLGATDDSVPKLSADVLFTPGAVSAKVSMLAVDPNVAEAGGVVAGRLRVVARDRYANPVASAAVQLYTTGTGSVLGDASGLTDAEGQWTTSISSTLAQTKSLVAHIDDAALYTAATFVGGAPVVLACSYLGASAYVGVPQTVVVAALDAYGNWAPDYRGSLGLSASAPSVTVPPTYSLAAADGGGHSFVSGISFAQAGNFVIGAQDISNAHFRCADMNTAVYAVPTVVPLYSQAAAWNSYVRNDGPTFAASNTPCDGTEPGTWANACVHGGALRSVSVPSAQNCNGLAAEDNLGAFAWVCDATTTPPRMVSAALQPRAGLRTLIDAEAHAFVPMRVRVTYNGALLFETAPAVLWPNAITHATGGGALQGNAIVVLDASAPASYTVGAAHTSVVVPAGMTLSSAGMTAPLTVSHASTVWIEGDFDAAQAPEAVVIDSSSRVVLRQSTLTAATGAALLASNMQQSLVDTLRVRYCSGAGLRLAAQSCDNTFMHLAIDAPGAQGVDFLAQAQRNMLRDAHVGHSGAEGLRLSEGANSNVFDGLRLSDNFVGLAIQDINRGVWHDVLIVGSTTASASITQSDDLVFAGITFATSLAGAGLDGKALNASVVHSAVLANHSQQGLVLASAANNTFVNLAAAHNGQTGVDLHDPNAIANRFFGRLSVGHNAAGDCMTSYDPGRNGVYTPAGQGSCAADTSVSDVTIDAQASYAASFVGLVAAGDAANGSSQSLAAPNAANIIDWSAFASPLRAWGAAQAAPMTAAARGGCGAGQSLCAIGDWRLAQTDATLLGALSPPDVAAKAVMHRWSDGTTTTFFLGASERLGDGVGNDNGLCEMGEDCIAEPNFGAYQGSGDIALSTSGAGIRLFRWTQP